MTLLPAERRSVRMIGSAEIERLDAGLVEIVDGFAAEELAADLVMRAGFLFE